MRSLVSGTLLVGLALAVALAVAQPARGDDEQAHFETHVRPLFVAHCVKCHGEKKQESGLRLDRKADALRGGDEGPVIAPGKPDASRLVKAVRYEGDLQMPPDAPLPAEQVAAIVRWIASGAAWPDDEARGAAEPATTEGIAAARREHWAFQPVVEPQLPDVANVDWSTAPLDAFVLARLEAGGLTPSPPADRRRLLRRVTFDLIGLPPTWQEWEAFRDDDSPGAYQRVVDRLLASPAYGQRWARHWLDVARYADTQGYRAGGVETRYPYAYTYRDYVVDALNGDLPYDRFLLEQLAADLLPDPRGPAAAAALGFLTVGRRFNNRTADILDDRIDVVTRGLLGLTAACARCHDHKYDPIPTTDYYSLYGVFAACDEPDELPLLVDRGGAPENDEFQKKLAERQRAVDAYLAGEHARLVSSFRTRVADYLLDVVRQAHPERLDDPARRRLRETKPKPRVTHRWETWLARKARGHDPIFAIWNELAALPRDNFAAAARAAVARLDAQAKGDDKKPLHPAILDAFRASPPASLAAAADLYGELFAEIERRWQEVAGKQESLPPDDEALRQVLYRPGSPPALELSAIEKSLAIDRLSKLRRLRREVVRWEAFGPGAPPRAMVLRDKVLRDGAAPPSQYVFLRGDPGRRGPDVPRQFLEVLAPHPRKPFGEGSGRLELARAIADPDNPLTARVAVNRAWLHHFGRGLVDSPDNFGLRGDPPSHPLLLDWLAARFVAGGWSRKWLHRTICLSATYRQQSLLRPDAHAVDPENRLLWRMNRRRLEFEALRDTFLAAAGRLDRTAGGRPVDLFKEPFSPRRTLYGLIDRQDLAPSLRVFDFASPDASVAVRPRTTVPQQALFLMNSPFVLEQARHLAARPEVAGQSDSPARIAALYRVILCRDPQPEELELARQYTEVAADPAAKLDAWQRLAQVLLLSSEVAVID